MCMHTELILPMHKAHLYVSLKSWGKKVPMIHSKIRRHQGLSDARKVPEKHHGPPARDGK